MSKKEIKVPASSEQLSDLKDSFQEIMKLPEDTAINIVLSRRKNNMPEFIMVFQEALQRLFDGEMTKSTFKILVFLWKNLKYSNHIGINQETIAEETDCSLPTVKKSIDELKKMDIILMYKDQQDRRRNIYILNPNTVWKGTERQRKKAVKFIDSNQLKLLFE